MDPAGRNPREPLQVGRGDHLLGLSRKLPQERVPARQVQFAEDIVHQHQGRPSRHRLQQPRLPQLQGNRHRALLALACELRAPPVQQQFDIIPVRPGTCLAQPRVQVPARLQRQAEILPASLGIIEF